MSMAKTDQTQDRVSVMKEAIDQIKDRFGDGAIMKLGEAKRMNVEASTTGCLSLDIALGVGGMPRGRIVEVYGHESLILNMRGRSALTSMIFLSPSLTAESRRLRLSKHWFARMRSMSL
jgi:hypothetical protein